MPDLIALEWDHDQISGVLAHVSPGRVRVRRCFVLGRPAMPVAGSGPMPVDWLKSELSSQGVSGGEVLVALPRDEAVVKRIDLPETSDDELPVLVRFQAGAKSSVPLHELSLDFIPLPRRNEVPGREVLMATVPQQTITEIRTMCETAGLQLQTLGLTPAAVAEFVARAEPARGDDLAGASLVVSRHGSRLEISVYRRCHLLFSHSARLSVDETGPEPQAIVAEVSRALVALRGAVPDVKIERVWTLLDAAAHEQLSEVLRKRLSCDVQPLDPFAAVEIDRDGELDASQFSGPIGLLLARSEPRVPGIDFLAPRQPPVKKDTRKRRQVAIGAGVAALVALLAAFQWMRVSDLDGRIAELQAANKALTDVINKGAPTRKSAEAVDRWEKGGVPWLEEIHAFTNNMPANDRILLKKLVLAPKFASQSAKIHAEGLAREKQDRVGLGDKLVSIDERYRVPPFTVLKSTTDDPHYPWKFDVEVLLTEPQKKKRTPSAGKPGEATATADEKPAEQKPADQKPGGPKPGEPKPGEPKPGEPKPGEPKPAEQKPAEPKTGDKKSETATPAPAAPKPEQGTRT